MDSSAESNRARDLSRRRRYLDGWQAGAVAVGVTLLCALLVVPRKAPPTELPLPRVDRLEQRREATILEDLARSSVRDGLPFTVRAVGERIRRLGSASAKDPDRGTDELKALRRSVKEARQQHGDGPLLSLRAVQTKLFLEATGRALKTGAADEDLIELAGTWLSFAKDRGIVQGSELRIAPGDLAATFLVRWTALTGLLNERAFSPSLNQWRAYYRARLSYPAVAGANPLDLKLLAADVEAFAKKDPEYPLFVARGVLSFAGGDAPRAAQSFLEHLARSDHGPLHLRVRNYLAAAVDTVP